MTDIKVGDEVHILTHNRFRGFPDGGYRGTVVKVGRKWATAEYEASATSFGREEIYQRAIEFDMGTGIARGDSMYNGDYVRTPEQLEQDKRREVSLSLLKEAGIDFRTGRERSFTLEQIEALAEVVKSREA